MPVPLIAAGISAAGGLGGGLLARSGSNSIADQQRQQATALFNRSQPAFDQSYGYYSNLLSGNPKQVMQAIGPNLQNVNTSFDTARQNILNSSYARGGGLTSGLAGLEGQRSQAFGSLIGNAQQGAASALSNLATGNANQAIGALQGASQASLGQSYLNQQGAQGFGGFLANIFATPGLFGHPQSQINTLNAPSATVGIGPVSDPGSYARMLGADNTGGI